MEEGRVRGLVWKLDQPWYKQGNFYFLTEIINLEIFRINPPFPPPPRRGNENQFGEESGEGWSMGEELFAFT